MLANKVVIHDRLGNITKGTTADFLPKKPLFHLMVAGDQDSVQEVSVNSLKGVCFVKDFDGDANYQEYKGFPDHRKPGKRVKAVFAEGEATYGHAQVIDYEQPGFFLFPSDGHWNNERVSAVFSALDQLEVDDVSTDWRGKRGQ